MGDWNDQFFNELMSSPGVNCKNREKVKEIVKKIVQDGSSKLQIITDFDRTLTRYHAHGKSVGKSSYGVLEDGTLMCPEYREAATALRDK